MKAKYGVLAALVVFTGLVFAASVQTFSWQRLYTDTHASDTFDSNDIATTWISGLAASPSKMIAVMANGNILVSTNLSTWTPTRISPKPTGNIVYGGSFFVFTSDDYDAETSEPFYSADGVSWLPGKDITNGIFKSDSGTLVHIGSRFLILTGTKVAVSTNAALWTQYPLVNSELTTHDPDGDMLHLSPLTTAAAKFYGIGTQSVTVDHEAGGPPSMVEYHPALFSSTDGITWTPAAAANAADHLVSAKIEDPTEEEGPQTVTQAGFTVITSLAVSSDGLRAVVAGEYAEAGSYPSPYHFHKVAVATSSDGGVSWTVKLAASDPALATAFVQPYDEYGYFGSDISLAYWDGTFVIIKHYALGNSLLPAFLSADGSTWQAAASLEVGFPPANAKSENYVDSLLVTSSGLFAATSYYPTGFSSDDSDGRESVGIFRVLPASASSAAPAPEPAISAKDAKIEKQIAKISKQLKAAKQIEDLEQRAAKLKALKKKLKALKQKLGK